MRMSCIVKEIMSNTQLQNIAIHKLDHGEGERLHILSSQMRLFKPIDDNLCIMMVKRLEKGV